MKRFIICAAAAIVALASCSKTEVVNIGAPEEIGFRAVTGSMTKGDQTGKTGTSFGQSMGVIAFNTSGKSLYFGNAEFTKQTVESTTAWFGTTAKYWPIDTGLDFIVYSPYQGSGVTCTTNESLSVVVTDNSSNQDDFLYSTYISNKSKVNVPVDFKHALAKVTINFKQNALVTIGTATLDNTVQSGTYTVYYSDEPAEVSWNITSATTANMTLTGGALTSDVLTSCLVVPSSATSITFKYTLSGGSELSKTVNLPSGNWQPGTHYIYDVTITASQIHFTVNTVADFGTGGTETVSI